MKRRGVVRSACPVCLVTLALFVPPLSPTRGCGIKLTVPARVVAGRTFQYTIEYTDGADCGFLSFQGVGAGGTGWWCVAPGAYPASTNTVTWEAALYERNDWLETGASPIATAAATSAFVDPYAVHCTARLIPEAAWVGNPVRGVAAVSRGILQSSWHWGDLSEDSPGLTASHVYSNPGVYEWWFYAAADSSATECGSLEVGCDTSGTITVYESGDLTVHHIETIQAIQDEQNSLPMVADKKTMVRVFPTVSGTPNSPMPGVTARLYGYRGESLLLLSPLVPDNEPITAYPEPLLTRDNPNHSLNFRLPPGWIGMGELSLRAEVQSLGIPDTYPDNNTSPPMIVRFSPRPMKVRYVLVSTDPQAKPSSQELMRAEQAGDLMRRMWPVAPLDYAAIDREPRQVTQYSYPETFSLLGTERARKGGPKEDITFGWWLRAGTCHGQANRDCDLISSPVPEDPITFFFRGVAHTALGELQSECAGFLPCHEGGHIYLLEHPATIPSPPILDSSAPFKPVRPPSCVEDRLVYDSQPGFDQLRLLLHNLDDIEMMVTGGRDYNRWISRASWKHLFDVVPLNWSGSLGVRAHAAEPEQLLLVRGSIARDGTASLDPVYLAVSPVGALGSGEYSILVEDAAGSLLANHAFSVNTLDEEFNTLDASWFVVTVPTPTGAARIRLVADGVTLAQRDASAHAPVIAFTTPVPGEAWDGSGTVEWTGFDQDGDALQYLLEYSPDDGQNWTVLALDLETPQYTLDSTLVPGGDQFWFRAVATDGLNTATAEAGPIAVAKKGPEVRVLHPADGAAIAAGIPFVLEATGFDLEDSTLPDEGLTWSSDLAGTLGTGGMVYVPGLQEGEHQIRLEARDSDGNMAEVSIQLQVVSAPGIVLDATALDFIGTALGTASENTFTAQNTGARPLTIQQFWSSDPLFEVVSPEVPLVLDAGGTAPITVRFTPLSLDPVAAILMVNSSDPVAPHVEVELIGAGVESTLGPVITGLDPVAGPIGTPVAITGTDFAAVPEENLVLFGDATAAVVEAAATYLVAVVPAGLAPGPAAVTVTAGGQTSDPAEFTVTPGLVFDLETGWSDTANPNAVWSLWNGPSLLQWTDTTVHAQDRAWEDPADPDRLPVMLQITPATEVADVYVNGDVLVHPNNYGNDAIIRWTSPVTGTVDVSGAVWHAQPGTGRTGWWGVAINGTVVTDGTVWDGGPYTRETPADLAAGSGGAAVLQDITVAPGDEIELRFHKVSSYGTYTGASLTIAVSVEQELIVNGGLELAPDDWGIIGVPAGSSYAGWDSVGPGDVEFVTELVPTAEGSGAVDLNGSAYGGAIAQTLNTEAGALYRLRFAMSGNPGAGLLQKTMDVFWNGTKVGSFVFLHQSDDTWTTMRWEFHELLVHGTGQDELRFASTTDTYADAGPMVDAITLVPEIAPALSIRRLAEDPSQVELCWESALSSSYQLEQTSNLADPVWVPVGDPLAGIGALLCVTDALVHDPPQRFYRVTMTRGDGGQVVGEMVLVPAGEFVMGDPLGEGHEYERPVHTVPVSGFYIDKYEVTKALWDDVLAWAVDHEYDLPVWTGGSGPTYPVDSVVWYDEGWYARPEASAADPRGPGSGTARILRGGNWAHDPFNLRCSTRDALSPNAWINTIGFRCVRGYMPTAALRRSD